jgi:hypothetical protein
MSTELFDKEHSPSELEKFFPIRKFIKAAKRVQRANKKLAKFEQGFISKEGIKDREWYKHLGVAPGKNLGEIHFHLFVQTFVDKLDYRLRCDDASCTYGGTHDREEYYTCGV